MNNNRRDIRESALHPPRPGGESLPQMVCLLDQQGRVVRANHTIERWGWDDAEAVRGIELHAALHGGCADPECYLARFGAWGTAELLAGRHAQCNAYDPVLKRHLAIQAQPTNAAAQQWSRYYATGELLAVVTVDDISALRCAEERILTHVEPPENSALGSTLLGILEEAVRKILAHPRAEGISVSVKKSEDALQLFIEDGGANEAQPGDASASRWRQGKMRRQAELSGGIYALEVAAGKGTRISISWPLRLGGA